MKRTYCSYEESKAFISKLGLQTKEDYYDWYDANKELAIL